jgi:hypothetical protein
MIEELTGNVVCVTLMIMIVSVKHTGNRYVGNKMNCIMGADHSGSAI